MFKVNENFAKLPGSYKDNWIGKRATEAANSIARERNSLRKYRKESIRIPGRAPGKGDHPSWNR